jgi:hypothetical protein
MSELRARPELPGADHYPDMAAEARATVASPAPGESWFTSRQTTSAGGIILTTGRANGRSTFLESAVHGSSYRDMSERLAVRLRRAGSLQPLPIGRTRDHWLTPRSAGREA